MKEYTSFIVQTARDYDLSPDTVQEVYDKTCKIEPKSPQFYDELKYIVLQRKNGVEHATYQDWVENVTSKQVETSAVKLPTVARNILPDMLPLSDKIQRRLDVRGATVQCLIPTQEVERWKQDAMDLEEGRGIGRMASRFTLLIAINTRGHAYIIDGDELAKNYPDDIIGEEFDCSHFIPPQGQDIVEGSCYMIDVTINYNRVGNPMDGEEWEIEFVINRILCSMTL